MTTSLIDADLVAGIRLIEQATGRRDVLSGFVHKLESSIDGFAAAFSECIARGDAAAAARAAHTLKGSCHQLGARALDELFASIEQATKLGDYAGAKQTFQDAGALIARSLEALKHA